MEWKHTLSGKEKVLCSAFSKEGYADSLLVYERPITIDAFLKKVQLYTVLPIANSFLQNWPYLLNRSPTSVCIYLLRMFSAVVLRKIYLRKRIGYMHVCSRSFCYLCTYLRKKVLYLDPYTIYVHYILPNKYLALTWSPLPTYFIKWLNVDYIDQT